MGEVRAPTREGPHAGESDVDIARHPQVIAVDMNRMREADFIAGICQRFQNVPRGDLPAFQGLVQPAEIALT